MAVPTLGSFAHGPEPADRLLTIGRVTICADYRDPRVGFVFPTRAGSRFTHDFNPPDRYVGFVFFAPSTPESS